MFVCIKYSRTSASSIHTEHTRTNWVLSIVNAYRFVDVCRLKFIVLASRTLHTSIERAWVRARGSGNVQDKKKFVYEFLSTFHVCVCVCGKL